MAAQRLPDRGAVGQPPHPHRAVAGAAAADDDRGTIGQRPDRHRAHRAGVSGKDLVAGGTATVGPTGVPGPIRGGVGDTDSQAVAAELVGRQLELAGPRRLVERSEVVGTLPVHGRSGSRRGGSRSIQVRHQPGRVYSEEVERVLQELIEPAGGGSVLGRVFAQVAILPARLLDLAKEHVEQGGFVAGLVPRDEQLVGEGLVEQPGDRTGTVLGRRGLE